MKSLAHLGVVVMFAAALAAQGAGANANAQSCVVCHPAAGRALAATPHKAVACVACHGELAAHVQEQAKPTGAPAAKVPAVAAAACATCHAGRELFAYQGKHELLPPPAARAPLPEPSERVVQALEQQEHDSGFRWSGLVEFGYRFVHVAGSQARFDSDIDLDDGARLRTLETKLTGGGDAFADEISLQAHDIGDPRWDTTGKVRKDGVYAASAGYRRDRFRYRSSGDYHRVDRDTGVGDYDAEVWLARDLRLFGSFERASEDGFWLTQRIGNRNVSVQSFVDGVESPRRYDSDTSTLGLAGTCGEDGEWTWSAAVDYLDDRGRDRWAFSRPAVVNPSFPEGEDFTSRNTLRGPGGRFALGRDRGGFAFDLVGRYVERDRNLAADGQSAGFDVAQFTTVTAAAGDGDTRTWLVDGSSTFAMTEQLRLVVDLHWRDHAENFVLHQTDVTTFPTLSTTTTTTTDQDQHTAQRLLDGGAQLEWDVDTALTVRGGYGFAREQLRVPDLDPNDPRDFRRGTLRDDGLLAGFDWKFDREWSLRGDLRDFGEDGVALTELAPERARSAEGALRWNGKTARASTFVKHRFARNDVSRHRLESFATGLHAGVTRGELSLDGDYTFARTDARTLTSFYFDPDPNPQPTFVGFDGDTHTIAGTLGLEPSQGVHWEATAVWTVTQGRFDLSTTDWRAGLRLDVAHGGAAGVELRAVRYLEDQGLDDYDARMLWVYWRQSF